MRRRHPYVLLFATPALLAAGATVVLILVIAANLPGVLLHRRNDP